MAEEAILKVSLKEYKQSIDDLRASLLALESTDKEYIDTAEEIKEKQSKLNEVMAIGKKQVDAVEGSYNDLSQKMSQLKKGWKDMVIGTQEWIDTAKEIDEINDQLKEADASVGVFTRNVGDYANAFEEAFKSCVDGVSGLDGSLGKNFSTIKKLQPLIKATTTSATKGLNGVKKAIIGTGIGALVVAVGLLVANFDKLLEVVQKLVPSIRSSKEETEGLVNANKDLLENNKTLSSEIDFQARLMEAQGASTELVTAYKREETKAILNNVEAQIAETNAKMESMKAHSAWTRFWKGENKQIEDLEESLKSLEEEQKSLNTTLTKFDQDDAINTAKANVEAARKVAEQAKKVREDTIKAEEDALKKRQEAQDAVLKRLDEDSKTELEKLKAKYDEEVELFKDNAEVLLALQEEYEKNKAKIESDYAKNKMDAENDKASSATSNTKRRNSLTLKGSELSDANFKADDDLLTQKIANLQTYMDAFSGTLAEREALELELTNMQAEQEDLRLQHTLEVKEAEEKAEKEKQERIVTTYNSLSSSISSIMSSVASAWEDSINRQVESGNMTEEEAKRQFESLKALQYATTIVETAQSAMGAFSALASIPYVGPALGAAAASAAVAAGAVQIATIKNTKFGGSSSSSNASFVMPTVQDAVPTVVANATGQSDTENLQEALSSMHIEVKVTDIEAAQNKSQVRVTETTW